MAVEYVLWHYVPSLPAAIIFAGLFGVLTAIHLVFTIHTRAKFCIPFVVGGLFEAVGYAFRGVAHFNTQKTLPYAIQSLLILLGPILFAASIYMILGRIIITVRAERHSPIPTKWLTKIFVAGDVICFAVQGGGGGVLSQAKKQSQIKLGEYIILGGLILQIAVFAVFIGVAGVFHIRARSDRACATRRIGVPWERYLLMLYMVSLMIAGRNVFRVTEYGMGSDGYLLTHEWTLYVFDAVQMVLVLGICGAWYKAKIVGKKGAVRDVEEMSSGEELK